MSKIIRVQFEVRFESLDFNKSKEYIKDKLKPFHTLRNLSIKEI